MTSAQCASAVVMVRPAAFNYNPDTAKDNYFMQADEGDAHALHVQTMALKEFNGAVEALTEAGVTVLVLDDSVQPVITPDSIFPNNWFSTHCDGQIAFYPLRSENRRNERTKLREPLCRALLANGFALKQIHDFSEELERSEVYVESTGSVIFHRPSRTAFAALSPRTTPEGVQKICEYLGFRAVTFNAYQSVVVDGKPIRSPIYHTNVLLSIGDGFAVLCTSSIDDMQERSMVVSEMEAIGLKVVDITEDQMAQMAGNILHLACADGSKVIAGSQSAWNSFTPEQVRELSEYGKPVPTDISTIEKHGGGSVRCMIGEVFLPVLAN